MGYVHIVSFDDFLKPETTALWWKRLIMNSSKVGKGLFIDNKAHILVSKHWIEAIDPRHRYGNNLHLYYKEWFKSSTNQHFLFWLDLGDGKEVDLEECPRSKLDQQCVKHFGPQEREYYEYVVVDGKILHNITRIPLHHGSPQLKYIFVVSTSKKLYIGEKERGFFHHSSFLAGEATLTAGRLLVKDGVLKRISPSSGHYNPTENSLERFLSILKKNGVNLHEVQCIVLHAMGKKDKTEKEKQEILQQRHGGIYRTGEDLRGNDYVNGENCMQSWVGSKG
ncbi:IQ domain-containing protein IQM3-like [Olea europaea var. sylvestris]|uniref:IQ domain-containing protein IQM3-like n=1 Tax=Olea europaea var. sylvestris TaxID=158386 RepID=UPI000C1D1C8F|nr:IQ domain-containing protein IQM3-like [Olea europaea var. sylvestris]